MNRTVAVIVLAISWAGVAWGSPFAIGGWGGKQTAKYADDYWFTAGPKLTMNETGLFVQWDIIDQLALRAQVAYNRGEETSVIAPDPPWLVYESKFEISGYPVKVNLLPSFRIGKWIIVRSGGGLSYAKYVCNKTINDNIPSTSFRRFWISGFGGQLCLAAEARIYSRLGLEAQYEAGTSYLKYTYSAPYPYPNEPSSFTTTLTPTTRTFRLGMVVHI